MSILGDHLGKDMVEKKAILDIAKAHGGKVNGDKDTISKLHDKGLILGNDIRYQKIAAILRFADELADDSQRAARYLDKDDLDLIPPNSPGLPCIRQEFAFCKY